MKSTNISIRDLVDALNGSRSLNNPVGYARSPHGQFLVAFIATHPKLDEAGKPNPLADTPVWVGDGERVKLNWRVSNRQGG